MKIDIFCNDGSPLGVTPRTVYGRGVGGAELALVMFAKVMTERGHHLTIFNDPDSKKIEIHNGVFYSPKKFFDPKDEERDIFVIFRSPNQFIQTAAGLKIHWSTDQYTIGKFDRDIFPFVDKIVCISPFHIRHFLSAYNTPREKLSYLDLGVNFSEYDYEIGKVKNQMIYCSIPDRGLEVVAQVWPKILERLPDAKLVVTSDYTLWGTKDPLNHKYRLAFSRLRNVQFKGNVNRRELIRLQKESEIMLYPCIYDELFCISAAECQVAGAFPITSSMGALESTNEFGILHKGNPKSPVWQNEYVNLVIETLQNREELRNKIQQGILKAKERFSWDKICERWEDLLETKKSS